MSGTTTSALEQENSSLAAAKFTLEIELQGARATIDSLNRQNDDLKSANDRLEEQLRDEQAKTSRLEQDKSGLTTAVQYQVATFANQAADSQDVEKIAELLAKPQISVSTPTRVLPTLIFNRTAIRAQSASAPYLLWVASRYGSLDAVFEHAEGIFNTALVPHAPQLWWIVDAVERLASRWTADIKVAMLLLQGVAYVRSSMPSYSPDTLMQGLNQYIDNLPDEFIVRSMYQKVSSFLEQGQLITSWLPNTAPGVRMLDHNSSALADNVQLIADKNGLLVLNQATNAGIITYVFEKGDIESLEFKEGALPLLRMKSAGVCRVPQELQDLQLAQVWNGMDALTFVYTYLLPF